MTDSEPVYRVENYSYPQGGSVYYRPRNRTPVNGSPAFPTPRIRPRTRRPQAIHILSYPSGYIPPDLRLQYISRPRKPAKPSKRRGTDGRKEKSASSTPGSSRAVLEKVLQPIKSHFASNASRQTPSSTAVPGSSRSSTSSWHEATRPPSMIAIPPNGASHMPASTMVDTRRSPMLGTAMQNTHRNSIMSMRSAKNIMSSAVTEVPKPVASGSGVSCSIILAEPNIFLTGFEHDGRPRHETSNSTALLRGKLQLDVTKNAKLKSVTLKLSGKARTEWPEGIPPLKVDQFEEESLRTQVLTFFHAMHETWETEYGNQCTYSIRRSNETSSNTNLAVPSQSQVPGGLRNRSNGNLTAKEYKRLSLQNQQSRSFGKGDSPAGNPVQLKGYKVFYPGTYEYSFELPIDHHQLETTKLPFGSVKWELETIVERAGAFKPNLHGTKEVCIVRVPDQLSLEMTEPISISRQWEDQLHYDIMISGKSFPIGTKIPIAFKLTPLAKVQVHKLKVFVTESIEYWTNDRRVTRKDPGRKILLLEKSAGKPLDKQFENSEVRVLSGGELSPDERHEARIAAARRRSVEASQRHTMPQPLPDPTDNLLGDLDLGLESYWGSTEIEMNVQIPTCEQMAKDKSMRLNPDCSWRNVNVYHWIKVSVPYCMCVYVFVLFIDMKQIVMRISRLDPEDPAGKRRRHFEISIDSPFTVLNCRATQANTSLPEYSGAEQPMYRQQATCGCPDANILATNPSPASSTGTIPSVEPTPLSAEASPLPPPPAAHIGTQAQAGGAQAVQRPIHLMRYPSFNPPAFDEDEAPPPLPTPPPQYDMVVGTPSVDGLADYFARLADYDDGDSDSGDDEFGHPSRIVQRGRVNVPHPRTPGGRAVPSRSFDIVRPTPMRLNMAGALNERRG
ncbi:putative Arrestin C-terminal-like domain-containing protein [Seiridium cardinale]|uniref:Arrestin C-terminal-like domain-containing protein n=1 Tax=Seiridium cardinale TaxID=138064 RepID=A0ABR2XL19_9PEZI